jgi:DHA2 family multidrug resistance protein
MIGLPFLFIPITTASYADLRPEQTNQASALINVARNLGGSIGVSLANTELVRRSQFHEARLTEHIVPSSPTYHDAAQRLAADLVSRGTSTLDAKHQALAALDRAVEQQAAILAYIDVFWSYAVFAVLMVGLALLLRRIKPPQTAGAC